MPESRPLVNGLALICESASRRMSFRRFLNALKACLSSSLVGGSGGGESALAMLLSSCWVPGPSLAVLCTCAIVLSAAFFRTFCQKALVIVPAESPGKVMPALPQVELQVSHSGGVTNVLLD